MWVRRAAIRPVPAHARVPASVLTRVESQLAGDDDSAKQQLDAAFQRFETTQEALSSRVSDALSKPLDETALALGYFLTLAIWLAFDAVFGDDLEEVTETALDAAEESLVLDEQIRSADPAEALESDDVIAMEQPDLLAFVHEHIDAALEANSGEVDVDDVHDIYQVVLVEVLALSYAVRAPKTAVATLPEFSA